MTLRLKSLLLPFVLAAALSACDSGNKQAQEAEAPTEVTTEAVPEGTPDNTQEVLDYYAAHPEFFKFASAEDLPAGEPASQMRTVIDLCDLIVRGEGIGQSGDFSSTDIPTEKWFPLGLNDTHHEKVIRALELALSKISTAAA